MVDCLVCLVGGTGGISWVFRDGTAGGSGMNCDFAEFSGIEIVCVSSV